MYVDILNIGLGFLEGFALIASPCILPILPIFLAGSLTGSKKRPIGIVIGFILIFSVFTFFSRKFVQYSGVDLNYIRYFSYIMLFSFGLIMISSFLTEKFSQISRRLTNTGASLSIANNPEGGFISGLIFGSLIALIWTPCAGPILAAVIVQTVIQQSNFLGFCTVLAFGLGASIPMLVIVVFGRKLMTKLGYIKQYANVIRKSLGVIILLSVGYMIYSDGIFNTALANQSSSTSAHGLQKGISTPYSAPAISGIETWINSPPLKIQDLKGKVVLIDFWTYSCINCMRTLPYLNDWYNKYHDKGLVIIGVHSPEFEFEKDLSNVKNAVIKDGIQYPVALDNQFTTWRSYDNKYWPAHYLIDKDGNVVYTHFGEGDYDVTENNIQYLLGLDHTDSSGAINKFESSQLLSPETYLGYARAKYFSSPETLNKDSQSLYTIPKELAANHWALQGKWKVMPDRIVSGQENAIIEMNFNARNVFIVMGNSTHEPIYVHLLLNGKKVDLEKGKDVTQSSIKVDSHSIYSAIELSHASSNILKIISTAPGLEVYTLTFGN